MPLFCHRLARLDDLDALRGLMGRAIAHLQRDFLDAAQIRASQHVMGLDTQLIRDGTYFVLLDGAVIAGCGGWSYRATLYGGDTSVVPRRRAHLDPAQEAARIRAMYTEPAYARQGVGRRLLELCECAAYERGFRSAELMGTLAGEPLYRSCGYRTVETVLSDAIDGVRVPLRRMTKELEGAAQP
jgi:GNAT superfamily N-acetyltransferase